MRPISVTKNANIGKRKNKKNVLGCLGAIITNVKTMAKEKSKNNDVDELQIEDIISASRKEIGYVAELTSMSQLQVIIMAACAERCSKYRCDLSDIADTLHTNYLRLLEFNDDILDLKRRGYMRIDRDNYVKLPREVLDAFRSNKAYVNSSTGLTTMAIMRRLKDLFDRIRDEEMEDDEFMEEVQALIDNNPDTAFSKEYKALNFERCEDIEVQLFLYLAHMYYNHDDDEIGRVQIEDAFSEEDKEDYITAHLFKESLWLMDNSIIEFANTDGIKSKDFIHICDDVKERLFADACVISQRKQIPADVIRSDNIVRRDMYYDADEKHQIDILSSMLSQERYSGVCDSLRSKGLRTGFSCLFYGSPGTGKTETVYQLAKSSGRDLLMVDVSQMKSCWVGESEKNIRGLFDKYRSMVKSSPMAPILLFNEADAIFGIRKEGAESAVDKMENSLQNIILQQMEDLEGILIATTNLTENLDKAFERRFLYKIRFDRPSEEAKRHIWKSLMPELTDDQAAELAAAFDLSGGQIENISRKRSIQSILDGVEPSFEDIRSFCSAETLSNVKKMARIGF